MTVTKKLTKALKIYIKKNMYWRGVEAESLTSYWRKYI